MTVSSRHLQPCEKCRRKHTCVLLDQEVREAVRHVEDLAAFLTERTPDAELVIDCHSFHPLAPKGKLR